MQNTISLKIPTNWKGVLVSVVVTCVSLALWIHDLKAGISRSHRASPLAGVIFGPIAILLFSQYYILDEHCLSIRLWGIRLRNIAWTDVKKFFYIESSEGIGFPCSIVLVLKGCPDCNPSKPSVARLAALHPFSCIRINIPKNLEDISFAEFCARISEMVII